MVTIGCVIGTRPELIKMAPIIFKLRASSWAKVIIINSAQHRSLLDNLFGLFELEPDIDLDTMKANQTLGELTGNLCHKFEKIFNSYSFDALLAAGDTTTVFITALIAFYHQIPFGHIEAGLRTYNQREPFPEEIDRVLVAPLATWHFVPTIMERANLQQEHINLEHVFITGNPVIDALHWIIANKPSNTHLNLENIVIVTSHRRENFGEKLTQICLSILQLTQKYPHLNFVIPVHPNPHVQQEIHKLLSHNAAIHLLPPLAYNDFIHLMNICLLILTDSGGVQEEAPALGKPVVVLRNITERPAIIEQGLGVLAGTDSQEIIRVVSNILEDQSLYSHMARGVSPYGDGHAAEKIVAVLHDYFHSSE